MAIQTQIKFILNENQADCIRHWRCVKGYTWRGIARLVAEHFPDLRDSNGSKVCTSSQFDGMALCRASQDYFKESDKDGWN